MAITLSSDYLYVIAMLKTTPLVVTIGLSLTIPFAVVGDIFLGHPVHTQVISGAILVMPKVKRKRAEFHSSSVKLGSRQHAFQDDVVKQDHASTVEATVNSFTSEGQASSATKKERLQIKREAFLQKLTSGPASYSKSHTRRLKRKAKEQIAGGLSDIHAAIAELEESTTKSDVARSVHEQDDPAALMPKHKVAPKPGRIGEGKGVPLTSTQRKRALQLEKLRQPLVLSNPSFSVDPFQTIRTHAQNTLVKHTS
ncbi:hypothetical protein AX17_000259 [Amanita inopinata Kibby_2008]|nr:hypothetical protein AX17_000259 [Amanita inopinata Kibby_2008]